MTYRWQVLHVLLSIGTIIVIDKDFTKDGEKFKSKVVDMSDGYVMIDYPTHIETGRTSFFMDGTQLQVNFTDSTKISYAFRTEVSGRLNKGIPMLKLTYPGDDQLIKIQRRQFVRVESAIDVAVEKNSLFSQYVAADLSAGGIALFLSNFTTLVAEEVVSLTIVLPFNSHDIKYVKLSAKVVRVWEKDGRIIASLEFEKVNAFVRQSIIRFCFERQLQMRDFK